MVRCGNPCQGCRTRHLKCDGNKPTCNRCAIEGRQCQWLKKPIFRNIKRAAKRRAQRISAPRLSISRHSPVLDSAADDRRSPVEHPPGRRAIASPSTHNLRSLPTAETLSGGSQPINSCAGVESNTWCLYQRNIRICTHLSWFRRYIPSLCPLLRPDELTYDNIVSLLDSNQPAQKAVALVVCALGEWCLNAIYPPSTTGEPRVKETELRCDEAAGLLERDNNKSLHHIRAYILIAFYRGLCGCLFESERYVAKAAKLLRYGPPRESLSGTINLDENSFRVAFWICVEMESETRPMLCRGILTEAQLDIPYPLVAEHGLENRAGAAFLSSVWVHKTKFAAADLISTKFHIAEPEKILVLNNAAEEYEKLYKPPLNSLFDFNTPSTDLATARIQAAWWNAKAAIYLPLIYRFCDNTLGLSGWHSDDLRNVTRGISALIGSLRAFHRVSGEPMIMPNIANTAYMQVRNLLLIEKCRTSSQPYMTLETDWEGLLRGTTLFLEAMSKGASELTVDVTSLTSLRKFACYTASSINNLAWNALRFRGSTFRDTENEAGGVQ
ncbi:hypothetical protein VTI28DRAFT_5483 [Corynascus sepedonium]